MDKQERMMERLQKAQALLDAATAEGRNLTDAEHAQTVTLMGEAMQIRDEIKTDSRDAELKAQLGRLFGGMPEQREESQPQAQLKGTLGQRFVGSPQWAAWLASVAPKGQFSVGQLGRSPSFEVKDLGLWERKDLITGLSDISAGAFVVPDDTGIYEPLGRAALVLRDLISIRQTTSDTVEFVRQTKQVTEAAPTAEANVKYPTGATGEITGTKPQGSMYFERVAETVKTIAVYVGATKRALADAAQIRGIIDQELRADLLDELEDQVLNGNGVGENFLGLANQPGTLIQAFGVDILTTTRRAITNLLVNGRQIPTSWLFSPTDWENVELIQDLNGRYYHGGPLAMGPARLWGVPVAQSFHMATGAAWLANWRKAVLWDRQNATITATDSHDDWFIRNMVAILGELRAAFGLIRPTAFCQVNLA